MQLKALVMHPAIADNYNLVVVDIQTKGPDQKMLSCISFLSQVSNLLPCYRYSYRLLKME
jgi:hypothetical protein